LIFSSGKVRLWEAFCLQRSLRGRIAELKQTILYNG